MDNSCSIISFQTIYRCADNNCYRNNWLSVATSFPGLFSLSWPRERSFKRGFAGEWTEVIMPYYSTGNTKLSALACMSHHHAFYWENRSRSRHNVEGFFCRCTIFRLAKPAFFRYNENFTLVRDFYVAFIELHSSYKIMLRQTKTKCTKAWHPKNQKVKKTRNNKRIETKTNELTC